MYTGAISAPEEATVDNTVQQLDQDLALAGYAESTRQDYIKVAQELTRFAGKPIISIDREDLRRFVSSVMARPVGISTKTNILCGLLFLYRRTLGRSELVSFIKLPKRHSPMPDVLSRDEVHAVLAAIRNPRWQAMAMVMYGAGLRIAEARALTVSDIDGVRNVIRVRHGKGNRAREAKLSPVLYDWLRQYWAHVRPPLPYLFANYLGRLPSFATVRKALKRAAEEASVKKRVTPHTTPLLAGPH